MRIVLFCEQKYAINILQPIEEEAEQEGGHELLWYVHQKNIPDFPLRNDTRWTNSIQKVYDFSPEVIFVPCNIVPYYLPGVKIQIFHGYAAEKKDHWVIRRYFDTYFTQGPFFTRGFKALAKKYKDFEVVETGWPRQDWIYANLHTFDNEKKVLLEKYRKSKLLLYAPTFSPSLTSLPFIKEGLVKIAKEKDILLILKFPSPYPAGVDGRIQSTLRTTRKYTLDRGSQYYQIPIDGRRYDQRHLFDRIRISFAG